MLQICCHVYYQGIMDMQLRLLSFIRHLCSNSQNLTKTNMAHHTFYFFTVLKIFSTKCNFGIFTLADILFS